jgi:uncharacterized membrane protein (DUF2068 family)
LNNPRYARFKVASSFIIAALGVIALARLALEVPLSGQTIAAYGVAAAIAAAGFWRGLIYLRAVRAAQRA